MGSATSGGSANDYSPGMGVTSPPFSSSSLGARGGGSTPSSFKEFSLGMPVLSSSPPFPTVQPGSSQGHSQRTTPTSMLGLSGSMSGRGAAGGLGGLHGASIRESGGWGVAGAEQDAGEGGAADRNDGNDTDDDVLFEASDDDDMAMPFAMPLVESSSQDVAAEGGVGGADNAAAAASAQHEGVGHFMQLCKAAPQLEAFSAPAPPPMSSVESLAMYQRMKDGF